jgi:undecaprenyl-diphosphatase
MGMMQLVVLAVVQGLTEFLPVSSSGHLVLMPSLFGWTDQGLAFDVAVHFGSLIAVCVFFRYDIGALLRGLRAILTGDIKADDARMVWYLGFATVPAAVAGLLLASWIAANLRDPMVVVVTLSGYGILMAGVDRFASSDRNITDIRIRDALMIGLAQALALIPGTSRSGITITTARFLGIARQDAARFSFLLSVPVILLATIYEAVILITGDAYISIEFFMRIVSAIGLLPFAIYRIVLAGIIIYVLL